MSDWKHKNKKSQCGKRYTYMGWLLRKLNLFIIPFPSFQGTMLKFRVDQVKPTNIFVSSPSTWEGREAMTGSETQFRQRHHQHTHSCSGGAPVQQRECRTTLGHPGTRQSWIQAALKLTNYSLTYWYQSIHSTNGIINRRLRQMVLTQLSKKSNTIGLSKCFLWVVSQPKQYLFLQELWSSEKQDYNNLNNLWCVILDILKRCWKDMFLMLYFLVFIALVFLKSSPQYFSF